MTATVEPALIELADCVPPDEATQYTPERIVDWLRTSGGPLGERAIKCAAAELIESSIS